MLARQDVLMSSLSDRLNQLGLRKASSVAQPTVEKKIDLCELLNAEKRENSCGEVVVLRQDFPYGYQHGNVIFSKQVTLTQIHKACQGVEPIANLGKLIFLDTETTGLAGGTGTMAFLVGLGRFTQNGFELTQFLMEDPTEEAALLLEISNYGQDAEGVVTFNGKSFDLPLLRSRYILNRLPVPFTKCIHLDLLHLSRKIWRLRLPSRALKDLEQEILHIPRSEEEVPGWMIPEIYFNFLRTQDGTQLKNVAYHNAMDIISLAALFLHVSSVLEGESELVDIDPVDLYSIGRIFESVGDLDQALHVYKKVVQTMKEDHYLIDEVLSRQAAIFKKFLDWPRALPLWKSLANNGDLNACVELAKYFEHERKDASVALDWVVQAEIILDKLTLPRHKKNMIIKEIKLRKARLEKRIENVSAKNSG